MSRRTGAILLVAALAAVAVPLGLRAVVQARLARAAAALGERLGTPLTIEDAEAGLSGTFTLHGVQLGEVLRADAVEAAVGLTHLLAGVFTADELRVVRPRLELQLRDGHLDLGALRRPERAPGGEAQGAGRLRRILVTGGELRLVVAGHGEVVAHGVELHPQEGGVRVVAGATRVSFAHRGLAGSAEFARAGLDVELPSLRVRRAALDGGRIAAGELVLDDVVVVRDGAVRVEGHIRGAGPLTASLAGDELSAEVEGLPLAPLGPLLPPWLRPEGRVSGRVSLGRGAPSPLRLEASVRAEGVVIDHPLLSGTPLPLHGRLTVDGSWDAGARAAEGRLRVETGRLVIDGDLAFVLDEAGGPARATVHATVPRVACADALGSLPDAIRAPLVGLDLGGELALGAEIAFDRARPDEARLDVALDLGCRVLRDGSSAAVARLAGAYVHELPGGGTRVLGPGDPHYVALRELPSFVPGAFVAAEDARFFQHNGFDAEQIRRSFTIDVAAGRVERGGSTISQQLVKNLWLTRERTLSRKLVEAVLTWNLEQNVSKARILEAYLNVIELGRGVYGIEPAARRWFGKSARHLTPPEAAFLAAITSAPSTAERRVGAMGRLDEHTMQRTGIVLAAMRRASFVHSADLRALLASLPRLKLHAEK